MATWIVHLRIADYYLKNNSIPKKYYREFIAGSLAPDCGYGVKDSYGDFTPPPEITHWAPGGLKLYCEYWKFRNVYLENKEKNSDYYFYLGYYIHLLVDIMWSTMMFLPTKIKYAAEYEKNPDYLQVIKVDWYDLDFKYLHDNPDFVPYKILTELTEVKDYLPYYEPGQLTEQIGFIRKYYQDGGERVLDREYPFLNEHEMASFIKCASELTDSDLIDKNLL